MYPETFRFITPSIDEDLTKLAKDIYPLLLEKLNNTSTSGGLNIDMKDYWTTEPNAAFTELCEILSVCGTKPERWFDMKTLEGFTMSLKNQYNDCAFDMFVEYEDDEPYQPIDASTSAPVDNDKVESSAEDPVIIFIKDAAKLGLITHLDLTGLFIDTSSKDACKYIIQNYHIDTDQVKSLVDDEGVSEELLWKLQLINEHEIELFGN